MTIRVKCALLLFSLMAVIQAQDLKCYVCDDCDSGYESTLQTCQSDSDVTSSPTGAPTEVPTAAPTAAPTVAPTAAPTTAPTAATTAAPTAASPTFPTTEPTVPTTAEIIATSDFTPTTTEITSTSDATPTTTEITSTSDVTPTTTEITSTSDATPTTTEITSTSDATSTTTEITSTTVATPTTTNSSNILVNNDTQQQPVVYLARYKRETTSNVTRCVVTSYQGYNKTMVKRGCSFGEMEDEMRCRNLIGNNYNQTLSRCYICNENGCNSATNLVISFIPFAISVILLQSI